MSGAMRKMGVYLGLLEDADTDYLDESYDEPAPRERARERTPRRSESERPNRHQDRHHDRSDAELTGEVASLADRRRVQAAASVPAAHRPAPSTVAHPLSRIVTLHPRTYNEARVIGENFRDGVPVIMNLSEMSDADAKRLVDFSAGLIFAVHGSIDRVTSKVFLLSPPDVSVTAEEKQRIAEGGFFNQS